jgi:hypothetical protein
MYMSVLFHVPAVEQRKHDAQAELPLKTNEAARDSCRRELLAVTWAVHPHTTTKFPECTESNGTVQESFVRCVADKCTWCRRCVVQIVGVDHSSPSVLYAGVKEQPSSKPARESLANVS